MIKIERILGREILDSRGLPTVAAQVWCSGGIIAEAKVPAGASTGKYEAVELRDEDEKRYFGKGVLRAVENINTDIQRSLKGRDITEQAMIDGLMLDLDGTNDKSRLGANAILAVSLACARAGAAAQGKALYGHINRLADGPRLNLPVPQMNVINGGRHANNNLSVQEFHLVPQHDDLTEAIRRGVEVYHALGEILQKDGLATEVGDEGGYAPPFKNTEEVFEFMVRAIHQVGYHASDEVKLGVDVAASELYDEEAGRYRLDGMKLTAVDMMNRYQQWYQQYPVVSFEDPFSEDDWKNWQTFTAGHGQRVQIVGDDLFVTNQARIERGIGIKAANAVLIKLNQIGTLTETLMAVRVAQLAGMKIVVSHRSGDTEDDFIADLAVGVGAESIKAGAPARSERCAKYNRLMAIAAEIKAGMV